MKNIIIEKSNDHIEKILERENIAIRYSDEVSLGFKGVFLDLSSVAGNDNSKLIIMNSSLTEREKKVVLRSLLERIGVEVE